MGDSRAKSFPDMLNLTIANHRQPSPFPIQLMLGIFWEESLFKNVRQFEGGKGVGFGQVEHGQLFQLTPNNPLALQHGYVVPGVSTATTAVNDDIAVQISSCFLLHLFHHPTNTGPDKIKFALAGYAGVRAADGTPLSPAKRQAKIDGWNRCALELAMFPLMNGHIQLSPGGFVGDIEDQLLKSLKPARDFDENAPDALGGGPDHTVRQRLFPPLWHMPLIAGMLPAFLASGVQLILGSVGPMVNVLQNLLNIQDVPDFMLTTDGVFGPMTLSAVQAFQKSRSLKVDGVVGPMTKKALVNA